MRKFLKALALAPFALGVWAGPGQALHAAQAVQASQAAHVAPLNLQAALDLAGKQNLDLAAARERRAVALAGIRIAQEHPNPSVSANVLRDTPHEAVWFDQPFEIGGERRRRREVAEQLGALTDVEISSLARQVRASTRQAFYGLAFARAATEREAELMKLAERLRQIAQDRYDAGDAAQLEVIQAELEVSRAQADFQVAEQKEKISLSQLNALLNVPAPTGWNLDGSLNDALPSVALPRLTEKAYNSNYDLQHLAQEQRIEESQRRLLRAERIPNLDLQLGLDLNAPGQGGFAYGPRSALSIALPLFSRNQGEIAQSIANQRVLEGEAMAMKRAVAGRVESAYYDLAAQQGQVAIYRQTLVPAAHRLESMAEESYRAGKTNILAVIDAQRNVQQVESSYLNSLVALQDSFATLEQTVGAALDR